MRERIRSGTAQRLRGHLVAWLLVATLAGCAIGPQSIRTQVTSFDDWSALPAERSYVFAPPLEYQHSLEMQSYQDIVRDELALQGFALEQDVAAANLVVTLRPAVSGTAVRSADPWPIDPFWGGYGGFGGFYGPGRWGYGRGFGYGYGDWGPYDFGGIRNATFEVFNRRLELDIDARATVGKRYYEGRAESTGSSDSLPLALPVLIRALFTDFPGNNGQTRRIDVPVVPPAAARP